MSQESEQAQEAWKEYIQITFIKERDDARKLLWDYKAALKAEIEKRLATIPKELLDKSDEQALGFYGALHFSLSLLDTVKPR